MYCLRPIETLPQAPSIEGISSRIIALPLKGSYRNLFAGPPGFVFIAEGTTLHKFNLKKLEAKEFGKKLRVSGVSYNGKHMLLKAGKIGRF
jgi:tricorn protease